jgi:hypothetical protein
MRIYALFVIGSTLLVATIAAAAQGETANERQRPPADRCVALKAGNPRVSDGIGIVFGPEVSPGIVERAVERWARCHGYGSDFPPFLLGELGTQTVEVRFERARNRTPRCGSFAGRTIVLSAFALDDKGRIQSCGSRADGLAHELGHLLGLLDATYGPDCFDHAMAPVDVTDRDRREIQPAECDAVGERWLTGEELEREPVLIATGAPGGG